MQRPTNLRRPARLLSATVAAVAAAIAVVTGIPGTAMAAPCAPDAQCTIPTCDVEYGQRPPSDCAVTHLASTRYTGWTYHVPNHCPQGLMCAQGGGIDYWTAPAWSWRANRWNSTRLSAGWVYVYPYSGQWRWAWTQASGWVAVSGSRFEVRQF